jgi:hypothetical protein
MWATRVLRMAAKKTTTGIVGLPVNPNARQDLIKIYQKTLQEIKLRRRSRRIPISLRKRFARSAVS